MLQLQKLSETTGVRYAAVVKLSGELINQAGKQDADIRLVAHTLATLNQIEAALEAKKWNDLLFDLDDGPVLFTPMGTELLVTAFDDVANLGRIRFAVKRTLAQKT